MQDPQEGLIAQLQKSVGYIIERAAATDALVRRTKTIIICLLMLFFVTSGIITYQVLAARSNIHDVCKSRNLGREGQRVIWTHLLDNQGPTPLLPPNATAEQVAEAQKRIQARAQLEKDLKDYFGPLKC